MGAKSQVRADSTRFQGESLDSDPSRERLDRSAALTFTHLSKINLQRVIRWHPRFPADGEWSGADWSNAMAGEVGEACNLVKKLRRVECGLRGVLDGDKSELLARLGEEIADVVIYGDLLASYYNIDLEAALIAKFNKVSELQGFPERLGDADAI